MDPQTRNFAILRTQFGQAHTKNLILTALSVESVFRPYLTRSVGDNPLKTGQFNSTGTERGADRADHPQNKGSTSHRLRVAVGPSQLESLFEKRRIPWRGPFPFLRI